MSPLSVRVPVLVVGGSLEYIVFDRATKHNTPPLMREQPLLEYKYGTRKHPSPSDHHKALVYLAFKHSANPLFVFFSSFFPFFFFPSPFHTIV